MPDCWFYVRRTIGLGNLSKLQKFQSRYYAPLSLMAERCFIASFAAVRALVTGFKLVTGSTLSPISATRSQCLMAFCR